MQHINKITLDEKGAVISHYLQNRNTKFARPFQKDALPHLYDNSSQFEADGLVAEPIMGYGI